MSDEDDDRNRAELAFLDERLSALRAELQRNEAELGASINDTTALQIVADVVSVLRTAGKAELAARYSATIQQATAAINYHRTLVAQGGATTRFCRRLARPRMTLRGSGFFGPH